MTTPPSQPTDGLTTAALVADQLGLPAGDAPKLAVTVAAVNGFVRRAASTTPEERSLGATMLAARVWRRRQTPEGVATFTDTGLVGVARSDPEVWMLLGLGSWAPPVVG
jgi:hypothetical protein